MYKVDNWVLMPACFPPHVKVYSSGPCSAESIHLGNRLHGRCGASRDEGLPVGGQGVVVGHVKQGDPVLARRLHRLGKVCKP